SALPQPHPQVDPEAGLDPGPPRPADRLAQPVVSGTALIGDAETLPDERLVVAGHALGGAVTGIQRQLQDLLLLPAQQGQDAVRGQPGERLDELEVVRELGPGLLPAV